MSERQNRSGVHRWKRILAPPIVALAMLAMLGAACSDDPAPQQAEQQQQTVSEQPTRQDYQQQQQVAMQEQQEAVAEYQQEQQAEYQQQQSVEYEQQAEQQEAVAEYQQEQQAEQAMQQAEQEQSAPAGGRSTRSSQPQRADPPPATTFEDYATTGWRLTENDDTSTFSLDVDRTSYFLALNWVENGFSIDPASVRAEEWINAFDYGYELPDTDNRFAVTTDIVEHPLHDDLHLVRIATQAPEFEDDTPLNVTLVLDASGSMADGARVAIARAAAESIRQSLGRDDRIAVVLFSDNVVNRVQHRRPSDDRIEEAIDMLYPRGGTNVQAGLDLGMEFADDIRRERPDAYNYVILMSDGVANVDATDPFAILRSSEDRDESNPIRLITVGVGIANYNDVLLEQLAQYGNGWYRYLSDVRQARNTFSRANWLALSVPFADQARAQVRWNDDSVVAWRLVGYENRVTSDRSFEQDRKEFAEIPMGSATTMFFEVELSDRALRRGTVDLGEVELRWVEPLSERSHSQQVQMVTNYILSLRDHPWLDLGSVVALAADRYSWFGQDGLSEDTWAQAADEVLHLADLYRTLEPVIRNSQAGRDFASLLDAMVAVAEPYQGEDPGYSR